MAWLTGAGAAGGASGATSALGTLGGANTAATGAQAAPASVGLSSGGGGKNGQGAPTPMGANPISTPASATAAPQVAPGIIQMAPGLQGPTMGAQDAVSAGLGQSGAPGSTYGQGVAPGGGVSGAAVRALLDRIGGAGGAGGGTPPPTQVAPGIIQMAPGLPGPTMSAADAEAAGLGQSGALGSTYGQGATNLGAVGAAPTRGWWSNFGFDQQPTMGMIARRLIGGSLGLPPQKGPEDYMKSFMQQLTAQQLQNPQRPLG
jgi:collagen type I alpha